MLKADSWQKLLDFCSILKACLVSPNQFSLTLRVWVVCPRKWALRPDGSLGSSLSLSPSPVLFAMKEDNEKVPTLLTDYILKGMSSPASWEQKWSSWGPSPRTPAEGVEPSVQPSQECSHQTKPGRAGKASGPLWGPRSHGVLHFGCC